MRVRACVRMCVFVCVCVRVRTCERALCTCVCLRLCTYVRACIVYLCVRMCVYVCACVRVRLHACACEGIEDALPLGVLSPREGLPAVFFLEGGLGGFPGLFKLNKIN